MTEEKLNGLVIHDIPSKKLFDELVKRGVIGEHDLSIVEQDAVESLGITGATVGQTVKIKTVDETGVPTEWEARDLPEPNIWHHVIDITTTEEVSSIEITQDKNGVSLADLKYNEFWVMVKFVGISTNTGTWWKVDAKSNDGEVASGGSSGGTSGTRQSQFYFFIRGQKMHWTDGGRTAPYSVVSSYQDWLGNFLDYKNSDHFVSLKIYEFDGGKIGVDTEIRIMGRRVENEKIS